MDFCINVVYDENVWLYYYDSTMQENKRFGIRRGEL